MKKRNYFILIAVAFGLILILSCGRKGPPFIPKKQVPHRVKELKGEWVKDGVLLRGKVSGSRDEEDEGLEITGCKVYYAWYSTEDAPCEGCPINFEELRNIRGDVVKGSRFECLIPDIMKKGVHFFRVHLIGSNGEIGPGSNSVKMSVQ